MTIFHLKHLIESWQARKQVNLFTPAHQGCSFSSEDEHAAIYKHDVYFLTRSRIEAIEKIISEKYKTRHTFWLTGGGTQGVLTACALLALRYQKVGITLNSHISVYNGMVISGLTPSFIPSKNVVATTAEVIHYLENTDVPAILLTHPAYDGSFLDIEKIAIVCREKNICCVVDESHGAHLPFTTYQPYSSLHASVDLVIHSMHKYTGGLVQTALLHLTQISCFKEHEVVQALSLFESTTRSNILLLSLEKAICYGFSDHGRAAYEETIQRCHKLRTQIIQESGHLRFTEKTQDPLKIVLTSHFYSDDELVNLFNQKNIDVECVLDNGVLLIFSFNHKEDHFIEVSRAITEINSLTASNKKSDFSHHFSRSPIMQRTPRDAYFSRKKDFLVKEAIGKISAYYYVKVPPGAPILIPGEEVTHWHLNQLPKDLKIYCIYNEE